MEHSEVGESVKLPSKIGWKLSRLILGKGYTYDQYVYDFCERKMVDHARNNGGIGLPNTDPIMKLYSELKKKRDDSKEAHVY